MNCFRSKCTCQHSLHVARLRKKMCTVATYVQHVTPITAVLPFAAQVQRAGAYSEECITAAIIGGAGGLGASVRIEEQWNDKGSPTTRTKKKCHLSWLTLYACACVRFCVHVMKLGAWKSSLLAEGLPSWSDQIILHQRLSKIWHSLQCATFEYCVESSWAMWKSYAIWTLHGIALQ